MKLTFKSTKIIIQITLIFILCAAITYIFWAYASFDRYLQSNVIVIMPKINDADFLFSNERVRDFAWDYKGSIETERLTGTIVESAYGHTSAFSYVSFTNPNYFNMIFTNFSDISPWLSENERVIVISESLAWALFGSLDVSGSVLRIGGILYTIHGVTADIVEFSRQSEGFAIIPNANSTLPSNIIYMKPDLYNPLNAFLHAVQLLETMNLRAENYTITDLNVYKSSIELRGQILLVLTLLCFYAFYFNYIYHLFRACQKKADRAIAIAFLFIGVLIASFFMQYVNIDIWLPSFAGEGLVRFNQMVFNIGLLAPRQYLPSNLTAVYELNLRANIAFSVGLIALAMILLNSFQPNKSS